MRTPLHHVPNVLGSNHTRADFDFDHHDGVWGPIRVSPSNNCLLPSDMPPMVWCRRHGWEKEIIPDGRELFRVDDPEAGKIWGWRCSTCGRTRVEARFSTRVLADRSLTDHRRGANHEHHVSFRLHAGDSPRQPHPAVLLAEGVRHAGD